MCSRSAGVLSGVTAIGRARRISCIKHNVQTWLDFFLSIVHAHNNIPCHKHTKTCQNWCRRCLVVTVNALTDSHDHVWLKVYHRRKKNLIVPPMEEVDDEYPGWNIVPRPRIWHFLGQVGCWDRESFQRDFRNVNQPVQILFIVLVF